MPDRLTLLDDLRTEYSELDTLVSPLSGKRWSTPTAAEGWSIAHQIAHLAWTDRCAALAVGAPEEFTRWLGDVRDQGATLVDSAAERGAAQDPAALLATWRDGRDGLLAVLADLPEDARCPWFGPPMKPTSMITARIMETWAHGQDVADALGVVRTPTVRLRHIAHLGVRTLGFAFALRGLPVPGEPVRVVLSAPDGDTWCWGQPTAPHRITGTALDFCLLVTRRRHPDDLDLVATGSVARAWLPLAQSFAGPPGPDREPTGAHR
ncbi:TIGR03084 family metal-binding protein [Streptomyces sp. NPDC048636]|uniref:TIGR03084 family metal-binding protein n=1 Tax=Streptomyces sp. NPDC048636 TaxID=3155762 RepID=UPI00343BF4D0